MGRNAVGFYWTLPVPWVGFKDLPKDIEGAAKASKTIRYQVQRIRANAQEEGYTLIREEVFLEVQPDRGTDTVISALNKIEEYCRAHSAALFFVDFSLAQGWRSHPPMEAWSRGKKIDIVPVWPDSVLMDGKTFDPRKHFEVWRAQQDAWSKSKSERIEIAITRAQKLRADKLSYEMIAASLNAEGLRSATGKPWTGEMVRKLPTERSNKS